ncbi:MAG: glycoside hydrolase family 78 protein, partial [Bacteroidota bacterium]|nr:glycoside hydrolase family 78 protein [Bacteroidota bacterium]
MQSAYEIKVAKSLEALEKDSDLIWHSGKIISDQSVHLKYEGAPLLSGEKHFWQVRVWDNSEKPSKWSAPAYFQTGLLSSNDWEAKWIQSTLIEDTINGPVTLFRKEFLSPKKIKSATAYITAHGLYEAYLNGKRIGDAYLSPGWTSYNKRLQYQVYDVKDLLQKGENAIGVMVGSGWYRGELGWLGDSKIYGDKVSLLFQLQIDYNDGTTEKIVTNSSWKASTGPIVSSEIYDGEIYDARKEKAGWANSKYNEGDWQPVLAMNFSKEVLVANYNEPIRKQETFKPVKVIKSPEGHSILDFGQNLVGWVQMKVSGNPGEQVVLHHAEVMSDGDIYTKNLKNADARDTYILKGKGTEIYEPHFTFHGFRYVKVVGYPGVLKPENFTAITLHSDMIPTGSFETSNPLVNQLHKNILWSQKGNFVDVPTDCPQRDERVGWTGDAQVFSRTSSFNMRVHNFFTKWLKDLAADQDENGAVPYFIPAIPVGQGEGPLAGAAGWGDAATIIPWNLYLAYGDKGIIEEQYESMKSWMDYIENNSKDDLWNTGFQFADWLSFRTEENDPFDTKSAITNKYFIAQCYYAHSLNILIKAAHLLGEISDEDHYRNRLSKVKDAFLKEYITPNGLFISDTQTAYVLALYFDMLPDNLIAPTVEKLVKNIEKYDYHLTTGFIGTPYLNHVLSRYGRSDIAYKLLLQDSYPSWLFPVTMGATTIWERWDSIKPDSTFQDPAMTSFNQYAYGAVGDWLYRCVAGIDTKEEGPGYKKIVIKPEPGEGINFARGVLQTYYGKVVSHWKQDNDKFILDVEIPVNTTAT